MRSRLTGRIFTVLLGLPLAGAAFSLEPMPVQDPVSEITRTAITSSTFVSAGCGASMQDLKMQFHSGEIDRIFAAPAEVDRALLDAEAKGRHFAREIRGKSRFVLCPTVAE